MSAMASFRQLGMGSHWQTTIGVGKPPNSPPRPSELNSCCRVPMLEEAILDVPPREYLMITRGWKKRGHVWRLWLGHLMMPSSARLSMGRSPLGWRFGVDNNPRSRAGVLRNNTKQNSER
jgi:hypothetical protein